MTGKTRALLAALLLCATLAGAQTAPAGYRIAGRVLDTVTGDPVARAVVSVLTADYKVTASAVTDAEGRFSFAGIPAGKYPLNAAKRGYRTSYYDEHDEFNSAIVTGPDQVTDNLVFHLPPAAVIRGVVSGEGGDPVESAQVMLFKRRTEGENTGRIEQVGTTLTDDTGAYEINDLPPGEYYVAVKGDPWYAQHPPRSNTQEQSPLDVAYPITFYDSTIDENSATPFTLAWGSRERADINLHAVPSVRFTIPLLPRNAHSQPHVTLQQKVFGSAVNTLNVAGAEGPTSGTLDLPGLAPGTYEVEMGNPPRRMTINATSSDVVLDSSAGTPSASVSGSVVMALGGPVPDDISLVLTSVDEGHTPVQADAHRGRFNFDAVPPGTWTIAAGSAKQTLAVLAIAQGEAMTAGDKIVVHDRPVQATIMVGRAQARVEGFAKKDGKGVSGAMIMLIPKDPRLYPALVRRDQSDSDGSFSLHDVPDGQYTVLAVQDGWKLDWMHREVIDPLLRSGIAINIASQTAAVVNLPQPVPVAAAP